MDRKYGYWRAADKFLKDRKIYGKVTFTYEQLRELVALALARGHYGDKVAYVDDLNGTARDSDGRHFDGGGCGADSWKY